MTTYSSRIAFSLILTLTTAPLAHAASTQSLIEVTKDLARCVGRLAAVELYSTSVADLQFSVSLNTRALAQAQKAAGFEDMVVRALADEASSRLSGELISNPMDARKLAAEAQKQCDVLAEEAQKVLRREGFAAASGRADKGTIQERPTKKHELSQTSGTTIEKPQASEDTVNREASVITEFRSWKDEEKRKKEQEAKAQELKEKEEAAAEKERIDKLKPIIERDRQQRELRAEIDNKRIEIQSQRKGDVLYRMSFFLAPDLDTHELRDGCEFTPVVAERVLEMFRGNPRNFQTEALAEINTWEKYIQNDAVYEFLATYLVDTFNGNDIAKIDKLSKIIEGNTFSTLCILHYIAPRFVAQVNKYMENSVQKLDSIEIDDSDPYYGLLCAQLAAENKFSILQRQLPEAHFSSKVRKFENVDKSIADLFAFTREKATTNDYLLNVILSNEWNKQCVEVTTVM